MNTDKWRTEMEIKRHDGYDIEGNKTGKDKRYCKRQMKNGNGRK